MNTTEEGQTWIDIVNSPEWKGRSLEFEAERKSYWDSLPWWERHSDAVSGIKALAFVLIGMPILGLAVGALSMVVLSNAATAVVFGLVAILILFGNTWTHGDVK